MKRLSETDPRTSIQLFPINTALQGPNSSCKEYGASKQSNKECGASNQ